MDCRLGCGACCIAPSIHVPIPGMPKGKPAGVPCVQLDENGLCRLFNDPSRPAICGAFSAEHSVCGEDRQQALSNLIELEQLTS